MRQARRIALILILQLNWSPHWLLAHPVADDTPLEQARSLVAKGDHDRAASLLEDSLPDTPLSNRGPLIELLRNCYTTLIKRSEAAGKAAEAAAFRENLEILDAAVPGTDASQAAPPLSPSPAAPSPQPRAASVDPKVSTVSAPATELRPLPRTSSPSEPEALREPAAVPNPDLAPLLSGPEPPVAQAPPTQDASPKGREPAPGRRTQVAPGNSLETAPAAPPTGAGALPSTSDASPNRMPQARNAPEVEPRETALAQADRLFNAKQYEEAGRAYARLAASNQLPAQRKQVWAYCRWVSVVARINAHPRDSREWDAIEQEIRSVQRLTPGNWYGEYLQNRVAEARKSSRPSGRAGRLVVRGSEPDENPPRKSPRLFGRSRAAGQSSPPSIPAEEPPRTLTLPAEPNGDTSAPAASPPAPPREDPAAEDPAGTDQVVPAPQGASGEAEAAQAPSIPAPPVPLAWQVRESANFRIYHMDPVLAEKASVAAEAVRTQQARRWGSSASRSRWAPACDIYLYPSPRDFAEMTGQPDTSPGFSTMGLNANRITSRRVNLRADHPQLLTAILPHEVTHVVLADLFTQQQVPRWADEGMAVMAEPLAEQMNRAADLTKPLEEGRVFKLNELMAIDYPNAEAWSLYYAQSVSLTQFLVQQGTPEQFIRFVHGSQRGGVEAALREVYKIDGFNQLENRWQQFARRQAAEIAALSRDSAAGAEATRRQ